MRSSVEIHNIVTGETRVVWQTEHLVEAPNFSGDGRFLVINGDGLLYRLALDGGGPVRIDRVVAVLEGAAKSAEGPSGVELVRAPADGDGTIVDVAAAAGAAVAAGDSRVLVVTADRGLRARLDPGALVAGPAWLNALLGR